MARETSPSAGIAEPSAAGLVKPGGRVVFLDGVRGLLAVVVVAAHVKWPLFADPLAIPARLSVLSFFVISGYVLARSYDGRPFVFFARRFVRLWPLYAAAMTAGSLLHGEVPALADLFWWPALPNRPPPMDPPAWTLYMEAWASFVLPALFWIAARYRLLAVLVPVFAIELVSIDDRLYFIAFFAAGVAAAQFDIPWPTRIPRVVAWLGQISYSLYLTHWIVMAWFQRVSGLSAMAALPLVFPVAWLAWRWIERPSIAWSRRVGRVAVARTRMAAVRSCPRGVLGAEPGDPKKQRTEAHVRVA